MDILFLGTSSGTPTRTRNVTALALLEESGSGWYLIDCGEATQHRLLRTPLSLHDLQAVFITHVHGDHCYGLPGLLASAGLLGRSRPLPVIAPDGIESWIRSTQALTQLFLPFELEFVATESLGTWNNGRLLVEPVRLSHRVPSFAYRFAQAGVEPALDTARLVRDGVPQGPLWGKLRRGLDVVHDGKTFHGRDYVRLLPPPGGIVVGGDNDRPELLRDACLEARLLIHEATYTEEVANRIGDTRGHSTAARVAAFAQSVGLPNLLLTHFSPRYQSDTSRSPSIADIRAEAVARYRGNLFLAEDFDRYRLSRAGQLSRIGSDS